MTLTELSHDGTLDMLERIRNIVWPPEHEDDSWTPDTIDNVAAVFTDYGLGPNMVSVRLPAAAWETLRETLELDSRSAAIDAELRTKIREALDQIEA